MPCKGVKIVKTTTTNKTTAETVEGVFLLESINFPENPETGSIHIVKFDDGLFVFEFTNQEWVQKIEDFKTGTTPGNFVWVSSVDDLPPAGEGAIMLDNNYTYFFTGVVDLGGLRLIAGENTTILGSSSENCRIKSTGLIGQPLITSSYSLPMRSITIEADWAIDLNGSTPTSAIDWFGVNFTDCNTVGTVANYSNFIMTDCAFLNSQGLTFDGSIGTVGFSQCIFDNRTGGTSIIIPSTATITRRFRIIYSSFISLAGETGINVSNTAAIPVESYILDTVNFSGGGTYTVGVDYTDNKSLFVNCKGIFNTAAVANYYMQNNATSTDIVIQGVAVKVAGVTTANAVNQKFSHTDNRATYTGSISRFFKCSAVVTALASGSGKVVGLYFAKNGNILTDSEIYATTQSNNKAENIAIQTITEFNNNDYIEVFVENASDNTDITVSFLNVILTT